MFWKNPISEYFEPLMHADKYRQILCVHLLFICDFILENELLKEVYPTF